MKSGLFRVLAILFVALKVLLGYRRLCSPGVLEACTTIERIEALGWVLLRHGHALGVIEAFTIATAARRRLAERCNLRNIHVVNDVSLFSIGPLGYLDHYIKYDILSGVRRYYITLEDPKKFVNDILLDEYVAASNGRIIVVRNERLRLFLRRVLRPLMIDFGWVMPMAEQPVYFVTATIAIQKRWEELGYPPLLDRHAFLKKYAGDHLEKVGLATWFDHACVHAREPGFHGEGDLAESFRNADIATYLPAFRELEARGLRVVRMGDPSMSMLPSMPNVLDYAHSERRAPLLDLLLIASSRCYLGSSSGLLRVAQTFGVPAAVTNFLPFSLASLDEDNISCPKRLYSLNANRELSFADMIAKPVASMLHYRAYEASNLRFIDNTPEQLAQVARELYELADTGSLPDSMLRKNAQLRDSVLAGGKLSEAFLDAVDLAAPEHLDDLGLKLYAPTKEALMEIANYYGGTNMLDNLDEARAFARSFLGADVPVHHPLDPWNEPWPKPPRRSRFKRRSGQNSRAGALDRSTKQIRQGAR